MSKVSHHPSPIGDTHLRGGNALDLPDDVTEAELAEFIALLIEGDLLDDDDDDDNGDSAGDGLPAILAAWVPEGSTMCVYHRNIATFSESMMTDAQRSVDRYSSALRQLLLVPSADRLVREDSVYFRRGALMALPEE